MSSAPPPQTQTSPQALVVGVAHLRAAWHAAVLSTEGSQSCWSRLTTALESGETCSTERHELDRALAQQAYAWAVYRSAVAEVQAGRTT